MKRTLVGIVLLSCFSVCVISDVEASIFSRGNSQSQASLQTTGIQQSTLQTLHGKLKALASSFKKAKDALKLSGALKTAVAKDHDYLKKIVDAALDAYQIENITKIEPRVDCVVGYTVGIHHSSTSSSIVAAYSPFAASAEICLGQAYGGQMSAVMSSMMDIVNDIQMIRTQIQQQGRNLETLAGTPTKSFARSVARLLISIEYIFKVLTGTPAAQLIQPLAQGLLAGFSTQQMGYNANPAYSSIGYSANPAYPLSTSTTSRTMSSSSAPASYSNAGYSASSLYSGNYATRR
jgi:hypothetical protein